MSPSKRLRASLASFSSRTEATSHINAKSAPRALLTCKLWTSFAMAISWQMCRQFSGHSTSYSVKSIVNMTAHGGDVTDRWRGEQEGCQRCRIRDMELKRPDETKSNRSIKI